MSTLSIFVDESGDFGDFEAHAPYYIISLVFHDQFNDITGGIRHLKKQVIEAGFPQEHAIHTGPLIRREKDYKYLSLVERRKMFRYLYDFSRVCDISYRSFVFKKKEFSSYEQLVGRMAKELGLFVRNHLDFFYGYDELIVYYDNGQKEITTIINAVFNVLVDAEIRRVKPSDYYLFQAADLFCTLELIQQKLQDGGLSASERTFFSSQRALKKNYLKPVARKKLA